MLRATYLLIFILFEGGNLHAQNTHFFPEMVIGTRSISYQHFVSYQFNKQWSVNNVSLFDTEYANDGKNIYFIRNMVSYNWNKSFKTNGAIGIKNPGSFATISSQYEFSNSHFKLSYALGSTYQNGFTLEQTLALNYTKIINSDIQAYINLFMVVSTDLKVLDRGIQQLRFGIKKEALVTGMAVNLDQFKKGSNPLQNYGFFIKYNL